LVLGRVPAPKSGDGRHRLELQAEGFHLLALCDDIPVFDELDGALTRGRFGTCAQPASGAEFSAVESAPPAVPVPVLAAVRSDGRIDVVARVPEQPAAAYALCLRLDRPGPLVPLTPGGCECFVLQAPALPLLAFGFAFGNAGAHGEIEGSCRWPAGKLMRGQAALVGGQIGTPNGEQALGWLPWAAVHW
jgi:hypothetical protein